MARTGKNEVLKETILFSLESILFTFSVFGSWMMQRTLNLDFLIEVSVQMCIILFYLIRLWGTEELSEKPFNTAAFSMALVPVFLMFLLNSFKIKSGVSWTVVPLSLVAAACEELHFRVNGCHLFREDGILGLSDCIVLIAVFAVCRVFTFIVEGVSLSVMSVMESVANGTLLLGLYLKTGNTKSIIIIHTLILIAERLIFETDILSIELVNVMIMFAIGIAFIDESNTIGNKSNSH